MRGAICSAGILQKLQKFRGPSACETDEEMGTKPSARWRSIQGTRGRGDGGWQSRHHLLQAPCRPPKKTKVLGRSQGQAAQGDCRLRFQLKERNGGGSNHQQTQRGQHGGVTAAAGFCWKGRSIPQPPQQQRGSSLQRRHAPASTRSQNSDKSPNGFTALKGKEKKKKRVLELNYCHLSLFCWLAECVATLWWRFINRLRALLKVSKIVPTPSLSSHWHE